MITDSTRVLLTGAIAPLSQRVVTWGEFRAVHSVTLSADELADMSDQLASPGGFCTFRGATVENCRPFLVTVRRARDGEQ